MLALYYKERNNMYIGELLSRYTLRLLGVGMKYLKDEDEAKDMVQQVFEKVLREVGNYKIENFGGWLYRIAQNYSISLLRSQVKTVDAENMRYVASERDLDPEAHWNTVNREDRLQEALKRLKEDQRICVSLFFLEKKSYQEIAAEHGFDIKQVKSNIQNGKRNLRLIMETLEEENYGKT